MLLAYKVAICTSHKSVKSEFTLIPGTKLLQSCIQQMKNIFVLNKNKTLWSVDLTSSQLGVCTIHSEAYVFQKK